MYAVFVRPLRGLTALISIVDNAGQGLTKQCDVAQYPNRAPVRPGHVHTSPRHNVPGCYRIIRTEEGDLLCIVFVSSQTMETALMESQQQKPCQRHALRSPIDAEEVQ